MTLMHLGFGHNNLYYLNEANNELRIQHEYSFCFPWIFTMKIDTM